MKVTGDIAYTMLSNTAGYMPGQIVEYTAFLNGEIVLKIRLRCRLIDDKSSEDDGMYRLWLSRSQRYMTVDARTVLPYIPNNNPDGRRWFEMELV